MPEAKKPLDFSDLGTLAQPENKFDFSDIGSKSEPGVPAPSVSDFEGDGGFLSNNEFARGVARSAANSAASVLDFVRTFADSDTLKRTSDDLSKLARNIPTKAASLDDLFDDPSLIPSYVGRVAGELAPQAVAAYLTGGTGAALGRAAGLSKAGVRVATGAGAAASSIPQEVGQIARETEELTGKIDSAAALGYGIPSGMLDALSAERIVGKVFNQASDEAKRRTWRKIVRDTLKEIPKSAATEGLTETAQEGLHVLADHAADQTFDLLTEKNGMRLLESAVAGAIGGGLLGGGMSTIQLPIQKAARNEAAQTVRLTRTIERALREIGTPANEEPPAQAPAPVREPSETELDYGTGGEMPRGPATWEQADVQQRLTRPIERTLKKIPADWVVAVQASVQVGDETMPGYVQIIDPAAQEKGTDKNPVVTVQTLQAHGYQVPDFSTLPGGRYTAAEAAMLSVMTPGEQGDYLSKRRTNDTQSREQLRAVQQEGQAPVQANIQEESAKTAPPSGVVQTPPEVANETPPQTPTVPVQAPAPVVEEKQAQGLPPNPPGVRPTEAPAPALPEGILELTDLSDAKTAGDLNKLKTKVQVQYDPAMSKGGLRQASTKDVMIALNPPSGKLAGKLLIQLPGATPRTIWSADIRDLRQAGILDGNRLNIEHLWRSSLLVKNPSKDFSAYKLPTEKLERNVDVDMTALVEAAKKSNPMAGAIIESWANAGMLDDVVIKNLTRIGSKYRTDNKYSSKTTEGKGAQVAFGIMGLIPNTVASLKVRAAQIQEKIKDEPTESELAELEEIRTHIAGLGLLHDQLRAGGKKFNEADAQVAATFLSNSSKFDELYSTQEEAEQQKSQSAKQSDPESSTGGVGDEEQFKRAAASGNEERFWDPARTDSIIGQIEDRNPKLYQSFEADPEDDAAWEKIEQELVTFLNGDKLSAEVLAEAIRQKRMEGWVASMQEGSEFTEFSGLTGVSATGKDGILSLLENRNIQLDPELRRIGIALINKVPSKYLSDLTLSVHSDGGFSGEFIPWLKTARVAIHAKDPLVAAHEISHYLATFLTDKEASMVSVFRKEQIDLVRQDPSSAGFIKWLDGLGGNATSEQFNEQVQIELANLIADPTSTEWAKLEGWYNLINDDEYFAHLISNKSKKLRPEVKTLKDKVIDILVQILTAIKAWVGNQDAYFDQLIRKFEKGEFEVEKNGGMLFDRNNLGRPKSLPPISSLPAIRKFDRVDQGQEEQALINTLTIEQNKPLVEHAIPAFRELDRRIRAELPGFASRAAALLEATRRGGTQTETPLRHYAVLVNGLTLQEEAKRLNSEIEQLLEDVKKQNLQAGKASMAEVRARELEETAQRLISDYKSYLLHEQRSSKNAGMADGLVEAIKSIDSLRHSTESLKRALEFLAETMSIEELTNPAASTQSIVDEFKKRIMELSGAPSWQQAVIPAGGTKPGISNEQLRIAVRIMQERQQLAQDIITYKELSDPDIASIMATGEVEFGQEIASLTYQKLRSFLKSYYSVRNKKDKAREIYLKHRARLKNLIEKVAIKDQALEFLQGSVIGSPQFQTAMSEAANKGFMSADIIRDHSGNDVLKRTYINPLNREEKIDIIDGTTKADYDRNIDNYEKVAEWYEAALENPQIDPLDKERINFELARIYEMEMNPVFNPEMGKRSPGLFNLPNALSNLTGSSLQFAMGKIGGRAAIQATAVFQARSEARRRAAEVRHDLQYPLQKSILEAARSHGINITRWTKEVAEPVLASFNSIGSKAIKAGDTTRYGHRVSGKDMAAVKQMKHFADAMSKASADMDLHTAKLHPVKVKEVVGGREILRQQQGGTELIMPRRFASTFLSMVDIWDKTKSSRKAADMVPQLASLIQSGQMFEELVLAHIYSTQRYADYANATRFNKAYREIYRKILDGTPPSSLEQVVQTVFDEQSGMDVADQLSSADILKAIVLEVDGIANKVMTKQSQDRAADTPGSSISMQSADNFMTKPRGEMIAPDSAYHYSIVDQNDIRWLTTSVLEVHEQLARDGLEKVKKMLQDYVREWSDSVKHPKAQQESRAQQVKGEDWLNYREAMQMLNQVNRHLDNTSPAAFRSFLDEQFGSIGRKAWSTVVQALLQSATVLKNNFLGMNLRLLHFDSQWRGDGIWMGMPRWLLKSGSIAKNGIIWPMRDLPAYIMSNYAYRQAKKKVRVSGLVGEDALHAIMHSPELFREATAQVSAYILKRAVNAQRAKELGASGSYGFRNQVEKYLVLGTYGGEFIELDQTAASKTKGIISSALGIFQETGAGLLLPRALAPRKLEQFLNFQAIRHADRLIDELTLNLKEAIQSRAELGVDAPLSDAELLGDQKAEAGDAQYMRNIFNRAGLNMDALIERLKNNPQRELLNPSEWNSFVLEVAKEMNMPSSDNRVTYKSGFARLMSSLMGYGMWYNERLAEAMAGNSRKRFDPAAIYRGMFFLGTIVAMGVLVGTPVQRLIKRLLFNEEDQTGKFSADNTAWRNAAVLWEQTAPFWPIIGSVFSQLYDARSGGGKLFNFLPISVASQALQMANEVGQTGDVFYPAVKMIKSLAPNTKILLNRLPQTEGITDVNSAARSLRSVADGSIEIRNFKGGGSVKYSPASTQIQMAVNEMAKENPDYEAINHYRDDAVKEFMKRGASKEDAQRRFDLSVLARFPQNTVYGRTLSPQEKLSQLSRMTPEQIGRLSRVEAAFDRYAETYGLRKPSQPRLARVTGGGGSVRLSRGRVRRRRGPRLVRNRALRRRTRRLVRG